MPGSAEALAALAGLRGRDLRAEGLVVAEGRLLAERLLAAPGFAPIGVLALPGLAARFETLVQGRCPLIVLPEGEMARVAGFPFHRGVLAAARRPAPLSASAWLAGAGRAAAGVLVLPASADPENVGALARSAQALGFGALFLGPDGADPFSRRALRVSMGALFSLPLFSAADPAILGELRAAGLIPWAAAIDPAAVPLDRWDPPPRTALILGPEHEGLDGRWKRASSGLVAIPMAAGPDSLNVAAAGAILLWEAGRARRQMFHAGGPGLAASPGLAARAAPG